MSSSGPDAQIIINRFYLLFYMYKVLPFSSVVKRWILAPKAPSQSWVLAISWESQVVKLCHFSL